MEQAYCEYEKVSLGQQPYKSFSPQRRKGAEKKLDARYVGC